MYCGTVVKGMGSGFRPPRFKSGFKSYYLFKISCNLLNLFVTQCCFFRMGMVTVSLKGTQRVVVKMK